jgi:hypothetical protein
VKHAEERLVSLKAWRPRIGRCSASSDSEISPAALEPQASAMRVVRFLRFARLVVGSWNASFSRPEHFKQRSSAAFEAQSRLRPHQRGPKPQNPAYFYRVICHFQLVSVFPAPRLEFAGRNDYYFRHLILFGSASAQSDDFFLA